LFYVNVRRYGIANGTVHIAAFFPVCDNLSRGSAMWILALSSKIAIVHMQDNTFHHIAIRQGAVLLNSYLNYAYFYNNLHYWNIFFLVFGIYAHAAERSIAVGSVLFFVDFVVALMIVVAVAQAQQVLAIILVRPVPPVAHPKIIASSQSQLNFQNFIYI
jgi:hypothetical protein